MAGSEGAERVKRLRRLDCCSVSDALDRLEIAGTVTGLAQQSGSGMVAGRAITVRLGVGERPAGALRHLGTTAVEMANSENVIVIEQRTGLDAGCWGGLLTLGAKCRGVAGVIADGPVRDIDEAQAYEFPIFSNRLTCITARGRVVEKDTNGTVMICDREVAAGDYVIADRSGVIFIPQDRIDEVLDVAEEIAGREAAMAKAILSGTAIGEVMGGNYENMLEVQQ